jgi:hypothetical protein
MSYSSIYHSPWHNPGLFLVANGLLLAFLLGRKAQSAEGSFLRNTLIGLAVLAMVDAGLTGELAPFPGDIVPLVAFPFVIVGDIRYFFLVERYAKADGQSSVWRPFLWSVLWGFIVPITAFATKMAFYPDRTNHWLFLNYESFFTVLAIVYNLFFLPRWMSSWSIPTDQKRWIRGHSLLVLGFYALWASSDVIILVFGHEWGYLVRMVPNILYYAVFLWFVALTAPKGMRP